MTSVAKFDLTGFASLAANERREVCGQCVLTEQTARPLH
jgi:hypothetical protein